MEQKRIPQEVAQGVPMGRELTRLLSELLNGTRASSIGTILSGLERAQEDIIEVTEEVTTIEGNLEGTYAIKVDGGGGGAFFSLQDGTAYGSAITLSADETTLEGDAINFGADTSFETTYNTFVTAQSGSGVRYRYGGPFPASGDLLLWFGPDSVALNSETKSNAVLAISVGDQDVFKDGVALGNAAQAFSVTVSGGPASFSGPGTGTQSTGSVTATPANGTGPYTYSWSIIDSSDAITINGPNSATTSFSASLSSGQTITGWAVVTVLDQDDNSVATGGVGILLTNTA